MNIAPMLMTFGNVRKILDGTKTQTRRVMVIEPATNAQGKPANWPPCPYGEPGDLLAIKETFFCWGNWIDLNLGLPGKPQWRWIDQTDADHPVLFPSDRDHSAPPKVKRGETGYHKRPSIYLPKEEWRVFLEITEIRVERLQEISEVDAMAEGCSGHPVDGHNGFPSGYSPIDEYRDLWNRINGTPRANGEDISWAANPWVWVIQFRPKP